VGIDFKPVKKVRQKGCVVWFTGLSGSGKSTLAHALAKTLERRGVQAFILDGDHIRKGLCRDLGFSKADRDEHIRRISEVAKLFADAGILCLAAFISPFRAARSRAKRTIGPKRFLEIHVATDLSVCERRDTKGLYGKARAAAIRDFTGVSQCYEPPTDPDLRIDTANVPVNRAVAELIALLKKRGMLPVLGH
jgi:adenylylsulfate kinase